MRRVTPEELGRAEGSKGQKALIAVEGKVYDVSASPLWKNGLHADFHRAGRDLTLDLDASPHGKAILARFAPVGMLEDS